MQSIGGVPSGRRFARDRLRPPFEILVLGPTEAFWYQQLLEAQEEPDR